MNKSPNWTEEEVMLALELYLSHDLRWLSRISDSTPEIIALSEVLNVTDFNAGCRGAKYRSTGSIRMKLSNFKSIDPKYQKQSLGNIGKTDRSVFETYYSNYEVLKSQCSEIVEKHINGTISDNVKAYLERFQISNRANLSDGLVFLQDLKVSLVAFQTSVSATLYPDILEKCDILSQSIDTVIKVGTETKPEHGGINQAVISSEGKIGQRVQALLNKAINDGMIDDAEIQKLTNEDWCRNTFHIGHPLLKEVELSKDTKEQRRDENGYLRYWQHTYQINGKDYFACKEWYESNRKYINAWFVSLCENKKVNIHMDLFTKLCKETRKLDENEVCVRKSDLLLAFPQDKTSVQSFIDFLFRRNIAVSFQGSINDFNIDDYEKFYELLNHPEEFSK